MKPAREFVAQNDFDFIGSKLSFSFYFWVEMALNSTERVMCGSWAKNSSTQRRRDVIRPVLVAPSVSAGCWCSRPHPAWRPSSHRHAIRPSTAPVASCRAAPLFTDAATYHRPGATPSSLLVSAAHTLVHRVSVRSSEDADRQVVMRRGGCDTADERFVSRPTVRFHWTRCAVIVFLLSARRSALYNCSF